MTDDSFLNNMIEFMTNDSVLDGLDELMNEMNKWIKDERQKYIEMHAQEIELMASKYEVTCDYYIAEFL